MPGSPHANLDSACPSLALGRAAHSECFVTDLSRTYDGWARAEPIHVERRAPSPAVRDSERQSRPAQELARRWVWVGVAHTKTRPAAPGGARTPPVRASVGPNGFRPFGPEFARSGRRQRDA